jgi:CheY-like chemotaxis protein
MEKRFPPISPFQQAEIVLLLVDEDIDLRELLCMALGGEPSFSVYAAATATDALQFLRVRIPDLVIIDYELSSGTGLHLYDQIQQQSAFPPIPGILLSAPLASCALEPRPLWVVQEPFDLDTLLAAVKQAVHWLEGSAHSDPITYPRRR